MINSTSKTDSVLRPEALALRQAQARPAAPRENAPTDIIDSANQDALKSALASQPEIRPEVVERAQQLRVDGNYPPKEIIRRLSELLVNAPDLSE